MVAGAVVAFNIDPNYAYILTGAILILAVSVDQIVHKNRERFQKAMAMRERARLDAELRAAKPQGAVATASSTDPRET